MAFQPGQSGNPGGRPKGMAAVATAARQYTEQAIAVLAANLEDENAKIREAAAIALLNRGWGAPAQSVTLSGDEDAPLIARIERVIVHPKD